MITVLFYATVKEAVQEGSCDETPFGRMIFRFSILHWHFATDITHKPSL